MRTNPPWMMDEGLTGNACALSGSALEIACSRSYVASVFLLEFSTIRRGDRLATTTPALRAEGAGFTRQTRKQGGPGTMKRTATLKTLMAVMTIALTALCNAATTPTQLPGVAEQPDSYFYTGKPYDADLGAYTFAARSYDPEINRWTSADPSGFPDGANNRRFAPSPTSELDSTGLEITRINSGSWVLSISYWLRYSYWESPTLSNSVLSGVTDISGFPAGYSLTMSGARLDGIGSTYWSNNDGEDWVTYTGQFLAEITLKATFGLKIGPFDLGPSYSQTITIGDSWSVNAME
jgi:RHS repeat-associated protein